MTVLISHLSQMNTILPQILIHLMLAIRQEIVDLLAN